MRDLLWPALLLLGLCAACATNSDEDCQRLCSWWAQYCTSEPVQSCVDDCKDTSESAAEGIERCVEGKGWSTPSTCQSAGCCVRFVYADYAERC